MVIDPWFLAFIVSTTAGVLWSVSREIHIRTLSYAAKNGAQKQLQVARVLTKVCDKIDQSDSRTREEFADVRQLILDVEKRGLIIRHGQQINVHGQAQVGDHNEQR